MSELVLKSNQSLVVHRTPAPLVIYSSIINSTGGAARISLDMTNNVSKMAFGTARSSTKAGMGLVKVVVRPVGLKPLADLAEYLMLFGLSVGEGATTGTINACSEVVRVLQQFFGDRESLSMAKEFMKTLGKEMRKTGKHIGVLDSWKCFTAWVSLQRYTKLQWREDYIFNGVREIVNEPVEVQVKKPKSMVYKSVKLWKRIIKIHKNHDGKHNEEPIINLEFSKDPAKLVDDLRHYIRFANGTYGEKALAAFAEKLPVSKFDSEKEFYANYCGISVADIVYYARHDNPVDFFSSEYIPNCCLSIDHQNATVVLAFRGTLSARDAVVDLHGEVLSLTLGDDPEPYLIHAGMLMVGSKAVASHTTLYKKLLDLLENNPGYSLTLTGHSLGGALASVVGILLADPDTCHTRRDSGLPYCRVRVYAFACPGVMDTNSGDKCKNLILTSIIGWDWLARISVNSVLEIRDAMLKLKSLDEESPGFLDKLLALQGHYDDSEEAKEYYDLRKAISEVHINQSEKTYPPGKIVWIHNSSHDEQKYSLHEVKDRSKVFSEILFEEYNLTHHLPLMYDTVFTTMDHYFE
ncbi:hypothetical protein BC833DRAFT_622315 [Globomyces pollinis-pini]|nr:hypothetical protein BC833DRAFT_622315 [Globomyces pollinis-pini]